MAVRSIKYIDFRFLSPDGSIVIKSLGMRTRLCLYPYDSLVKKYHLNSHRTQPRAIKRKKKQIKISIIAQ